MVQVSALIDRGLKAHGTMEGADVCYDCAVIALAATGTGVLEPYD